MTCSAGKENYAYHYVLSVTGHHRKPALYHGVTVLDHKIATNRQYEALKNRLKQLHGDIYCGAVLIKLALMGEPT